MKLHISKGNTKVNKVANFSLVPVETCPNHQFCFQPDLKLKCYAIKAYKQYPPVRKAWRENTEIARNNIDQFKSEMINFLGKYKGDMFRIHVAGDFFSQEYLNAWFAICAMFPHIKFLAFTKSFHLDFSKKSNNLKVVWSIMPGMKEYPSTGSCAFAGDSVPNGIKTIECNGNCEKCGRCWNLKDGKHVHFHIH